MTRAHRSLLILTAVTVLATGSIAQTLAGPAGIGADVRLTASLLLLAASATLLARVIRHLTRGEPTRPACTHSDSAGPDSTGPHLPPTPITGGSR